LKSGALGEFVDRHKVREFDIMKLTVFLGKKVSYERLAMSDTFSRCV